MSLSGPGSNIGNSGPLNVLYIDGYTSYSLVADRNVDCGNKFPVIRLLFGRGVCGIDV